MVSAKIATFTQDSGDRARSRGELDSREKVRLLFAGPGEIKRREVVLDPQDNPKKSLWNCENLRPGGAILRPRVGQIYCKKCVCDPHLKFLSGEMLGSESLTSFCFSCSSTAVLRTLSLWLLSTAVETAIADVLAVVHGLLGLLCQRSSHSLFLPLPFPAPSPLSPAVISHIASVDVKQHVYLLISQR